MTIEELKQRYPGMLLLFRYGSDYRFMLPEHDAIAKEKGLDYPLSNADGTGTLEKGLRLLLNAGCRIAVCDSEDYTF